MCDRRRKGTAFDNILTNHHQTWLPTTQSILKMLLIVLFLFPRLAHGKEYFVANFNITYRDSITNKTHSDSYVSGRFGVGVESTPKVAPAYGMVVHVRTKENKTDGCTDYDFKLPSVKWIALIARGTCSFTEKIRRAAKTYNASAVVVYNDEVETHIMEHTDEDVVAISVPEKDGHIISSLVDRGINVTMYIFVGDKKVAKETVGDKNPSKTSVVFVSVSFIVLMIISLAWLVFYYIQRFRYAHAKERLARRLASAAKKAIAKIPQKTVKNGDKELGSDFDQCAVCIEGYKAHDIIRTLPCKHVFHKSCVDPWLLDQRSCPMCKLDILRAYGMHVGGSEDSVHPDGDSGNAMSPVEDLEQTSVGDEQSADGEVKVLLLPQQHVYLHHQGGETSSAGGARGSVDSDHLVCAAGEEECRHSSDTECTELHLLMEHDNGSGGSGADGGGGGGTAEVQVLLSAVEGHKEAEDSPA